MVGWNENEALGSEESKAVGSELLKVFNRGKKRSRVFTA
jgi:hypothetical protein